MASFLMLAACSTNNITPEPSSNSVLQQTAKQGSNNLEAQQKAITSVNPYPKWLVNTPESTAAACAKIINDNLPQAKKVALAKAQAELAFIETTHIESSIIINKEIDDKNTIKTQLTQQSNQATAGEISGYFIKASEIVTLKNRQEYCLLIGKL